MVGGVLTASPQELNLEARGACTNRLGSKPARRAAAMSARVAGRNKGFVLVEELVELGEEGGDPVVRVEAMSSGIVQMKIVPMG